MHRFTQLITVLTMVATVAVNTACVKAQQLDDEKVGKAIDRIKSYLYKNQAANGTWEHLYTAGHVGEGGATVVVVTALLISGESAQNPKLLKAINWLREKNKEEVYKLGGDDTPGKTYVVGLRAHVWGALPKEYLPLLEREAEWLIGAAQKDATYNYGWNPKGTRYDHSNTQYGILGLWEAAKRGIHISSGFWERVEDHFIKVQLPDGGWNYVHSQARPSYQAMTTAGITALLTARQELYDTESPEKIDSAIEKGLQWMDKNYNPGDSLYSLYGTERVALASGTRYFNGKDWYKSGAQRILSKQSPGGNVGSLPDTCFALMFLARGRQPVWVTKLRMPGVNWNNRPNDIYHLTNFLSDQREGELNWQVIDVAKRPVDDLLTTPMAYLSVPAGSVEMDADISGKIKQYIDLGGMLVVNLEGNNSATRASIENIAAEWYPDLKFRNLEPDHPAFRSWFQLDPKDARGMRGLSNGARELIITTGADWGSVTYAATGQRQANKAWLMAQNIFALATDRGVINNRLVERVLRQTGEPKSEVTVGRAKYAGNWLPEPGAWQMQSRFMVNHNGTAVKTQDIDLANISASGLQVVHVAGTREQKLSQAEIDGIVNFARAGGTVIVETVGGMGNFARGVEQQLADAFKRNAVELASSEPLLNGKGINGAFDNSRVSYRRHAIDSMAVKSRPRLAAFYEGEKPAVIISNEDLSLGMLGVEHWGVLGYSPESSRQIMTNIALRGK